MQTRRDFLRAAGAASIAGSQRPGAPSPNDRLNILAIGLGARGTKIALSTAGFGRVVAVCDADSAQTDAFLEKLAEQQAGKPDIYKDYRKALERKNIDVVTIGTPDHWHTAILLDALRTGRDVYCEKPLTLTIDEGKVICKAVQATRRVVQVGTQQRSEMKRMFLKAVAIARAGRLGKKLTATCMIGTHQPGGPFPVTDPPGTLDWDLWLGQAPKAPYSVQRCHRTFRQWFEYSGGMMTDWGAHHVDIAQWALGADNTGPTEIEGQGELPCGREATLAMLVRQERLPNCYNTATAFRITMRFASGDTIIVREGPRNGIEIEGEKSRLFVSRGELTGPAIDQIQESGKEQAWLEDEVVRLYKGREPTTHMNNFRDCVRERSQPISDVFTHQRSVTSCHLANIALLLGRKLKWDPAAEDFPGDKEARALLKRERRRPYVIPS
jgi:predicted dehydrogenase